MVGKASHQMEWPLFTSNTSRLGHRDRCIHHRMGCTVSRGENRGALVTDRAPDAHKLPGAISSIPGNTIICQGEEKNTYPSEDGQHNSPYLHKQIWGHSVSGAEPTNQRVVAVVPRQEHNTAGNPPRWDPEPHSRRRVTCDEGQVRLDAVSEDIQQNQPKSRTTTGGSVCLSSDPPAQELCELETRSRGHGNRCLHTGLDKVQRLCQSSLESGEQSPDTCQEPESEGDINCTSLEISTLVPCTPRNASPGTSSSASQSNPDHTDSQSQQTRHSTTTSRVDYLRDRFRGHNLSEEASKLLFASWWQKTSKPYDSLFGKWVRWCNQRYTNPISGDINEVVNFLAELFQQGYQYRSLNAYRSAISSVHERVDGYEVGQHPLVTRLIKGVFHERPPQPRYTVTWDVAIVTAYLEALGANDKLHLDDLTHKTAMLMALTRPSRSADLSGLNLDQKRYSPEGVTFTPTKLAKQSRQTKKVTQFFFPSFPAKVSLCPVATLRAYEERTRERREGKGHSQLFISLIKPYNPVSSSTISRWLKSVLTKAGIDTSIFKAHSVRGASTSAAASAGVTTNDILNAVDWSSDSESVFQRFYYKPEQRTHLELQYYQSCQPLSQK